MKQDFIIPQVDKVSVGEPLMRLKEEHPEITWARKTLKEFPGTHFYMPAYYRDGEASGIVECQPCYCGYIAFVATGVPSFCEAQKFNERFNRIFAPEQGAALATWGALGELIPEFSKHPARAVPKDVFLKAFNMVAAGQSITLAGHPTVKS